MGEMKNVVVVRLYVIRFEIVIKRSAVPAPVGAKCDHQEFARLPRLLAGLRDHGASISIFIVGEVGDVEYDLCALEIEQIVDQLRVFLLEFGDERRLFVKLLLADNGQPAQP